MLTAIKMVEDGVSVNKTAELLRRTLDDRIKGRISHSSHP